MKTALLTILGIAIFYACALLARSTYSCELVCSRCLATQHVYEERLLGLPLQTRTTDGEPGEDYQSVFGHSCDHAFHRGGFGLQTISGIRCGVTSEGSRYGFRDRAVKMAFAAGKRCHNQSLTKRTLALIDRVTPPDPMQSPPGDEIDSKILTILVRLANDLPLASDDRRWSLILKTAENNFAKTQSPPSGPNP